MKKNLKTAVSLMVLCFCLCCAHGKPARAAEFNPHDWQLRLRAIDVMPQESSHGSIAGEASLGNSVVPELDISYFLTDNWSAELILATSKHNVGWSGGIDLGSTWVLPPTLTAQYHFTPDKQFSPYLGAGINYTIFYGGDNGAFNSVKYDNGFGYALQAGFDYKLDTHWMLNADVKKIFLDTDVSVNHGAVKADVDVDPWVLGLGVGYRF